MKKRKKLALINTELVWSPFFFYSSLFISFCHLLDSFLQACSSFVVAVVVVSVTLCVLFRCVA